MRAIDDARRFAVSEDAGMSNSGAWPPPSSMERSANGEWRMANGEWRMANGEWRMANGECDARRPARRRRCVAGMRILHPDCRLIPAAAFRPPRAPWRASRATLPTQAVL
ncbi:hypothetical protein D7S92_19420 [Burkholderia contaminans]|nr:hypothetical protein [Burkholderia contaminans]